MSEIQKQPQPLETSLEHRDLGVLAVTTAENGEASREIPVTELADKVGRTIGGIMDTLSQLDGLSYRYWGNHRVEDGGAESVDLIVTERPRSRLSVAANREHNTWNYQFSERGLNSPSSTNESVTWSAGKLTARSERCTATGQWARGEYSSENLDDTQVLEKILLKLDDALLKQLESYEEELSGHTLRALGDTTYNVAPSRGPLGDYSYQGVVPLQARNGKVWR